MYIHFRKYVTSAANPTRSALVFFFNDPATTEIYTLSLHDALPISHETGDVPQRSAGGDLAGRVDPVRDRKRTRLNSSHRTKSYAVFCLKKKKKEAFINTHYEVHIDTAVIVTDVDGL